MKYIQAYALFLMLVFCTSCGGQNKPDFPKEKINSEKGENFFGYSSNFSNLGVRQLLYFTSAFVPGRPYFKYRHKHKCFNVTTHWLQTHKNQLKLRNIKWDFLIIDA